MINEQRRRFLKFFSTSFLTLSVSPYIIGVNQEAFADSRNSFNKHNFFNPLEIGWDDAGPWKAESESILGRLGMPLTPVAIITWRGDM